MKSNSDIEIDDSAESYRLVVGLGATGVSTMKYLSDRAIAFEAYDQIRPSNDDRFWADIEGIATKQELHFADDDAVLEKAGLIYLSPGIAPDAEWLSQKVKQDAVLSGDLDLFVAAATAPIIAITGSNAKSTVTTVVGQMLEASGFKVGVGGNLGPPMLDLLDSENDFYVIELSSFQLERSAGLKDHLACILNISEDHLDRHGSYERYVAEKRKVLSGAKRIVFSRDDVQTHPIAQEDSDSISFGSDAPSKDGFGLRNSERGLIAMRGAEKLFSAEDINLVGAHGMLNLIAACAIASSVGVGIDVMREVCCAFPGLPHRCQLVATKQGVRYVDDSKATNVGAAIAALEGLAVGLKPESKIILIVGGRAKQADFRPLAQKCSSLSVLPIVIGEAAMQIAQHFVECSIQVQHAESMRDAVAKAALLARSGDHVLLAPACASFDMFRNYEARGEAFVSSVAGLNDQETVENLANARGGLDV